MDEQRKKQMLEQLFARQNEGMELARDKMVADAPVMKMMGAMQLSPEQNAKLQDPGLARDVANAEMAFNAAGGAMGSIAKVGGQSAAQAVANAQKPGQSAIEKFMEMRKGLQREGGAAQRLGTEGQTAKSLAGDVSRDLQGIGKDPNMTDVAFKMQILNKIKDRGY